MLQSWLLRAFLFAPFGALSHTPVITMDEICVVTACRPARLVRLVAENGDTATVRIERAPYIYHGQLTVLAGESVLLEGEERDGHLVIRGPVSALADPRRTLVIRFDQAPVGAANAPTMVLSVTNPFPKPIRYRAARIPLGLDRLVATRVCPVMAGLERTQTWPEPTVEVLLLDFRFIDEHANESLACE